MPDSNPLLDKLLQSKNCRDLCPDTVRRVWAECERRYKKPKDAEKAAREALHGISGAFMTPGEARQLAYDMQDWHTKHTDVGLEKMLSRHASTRERAGILDELYREIFRDMPQPKTICDLACGLNPFSIPWMPLEPGFRYEAYDLFSDMSDLINCFFEKRGIDGNASQANLLYGLPGGPYDLVLLFKVIPCLEQIDKFGGRHILEQLAYAARYAAVSFPGASLSGKEKGMPRNYEAHFMNIVDQEAWEIRKVKYPSELVFILKSKVFYGS